MTTSQRPSATDDHIAWVDLLRIVACFLVVLAHCCDPFVAGFEKSISDFQAGVFWGSFVRPCVPLFAMISGVLLFPIHTDMGTFYKKRLKRILIPLVVWSIVLPVIYYLYFATGVHSANPNIVADNYTWAATIKKTYLFLFNFNYDTTPLWYLYMLAGLYLFMPIIGGWLNQARKKDIQIFLGIWIISMCIPSFQSFIAPKLGYAGNFGNMGVLGVCDWNPYGMFYYFAGFMGYIVMAYYLRKYPLNWSWGTTLSICLPLFAIGYTITSLGFFEIQKIYPGQYSMLEIIWYFSGINVFLMTFAFYVIISKIRVKPSPFLSKVAALTFGIYLCHFVFVQIAYDGFGCLFSQVGLKLPAAIQIPALAIVSFLISLGLTWALSLNKVTRKSIM